jgi:hypothetical protein
MTSRVRGILFQRVATRSPNARIIENFCSNLAGPRRGAGVAEQGCLLSIKHPTFNNLQVVTVCTRIYHKLARTNELRLI